jgi:ubiquinone biosynthesis protein
VKKNRQGLPFATIKEAGRVGLAWVKHGVIGIPFGVGKAALQGPVVDHPFLGDRFLELLGDRILDLFNDLGPVYGKFAQISLSRLGPGQQELIQKIHLDRLYGDWPALPLVEVEAILDHEIPQWRRQLRLEARPLGVASVAQVHSAIDSQGKNWVVKIIKPDAAKRMGETIAAIEQILRYYEPFALTAASKGLVRDSRDLCRGLRGELSLDKERQTIAKVRAKLAGKRQKLLRIPEVQTSLSTNKVMTLERFEGKPLKDIISGKVVLALDVRRKLARSLLHELLVQVFEMGLFHGDPHAGNLILMDDGSLGLFDWGLAGELAESDRRHIANVLKAVITLDMDRLVEALYQLALDSQTEVSQAEVRKEVQKIAAKVKKAKDEQKKIALTTMIEMCLASANKLAIVLPEGLLLMSKSLVTIEGLAKGIDPEVPLKRIASPLLLRAAKPGLQDLLRMGQNLPKLARHFLR